MHNGQDRCIKAEFSTEKIVYPLVEDCMTKKEGSIEWSARDSTRRLKKGNARALGMPIVFKETSKFKKDTKQQSVGMTLEDISTTATPKWSKQINL